MSEINRDVINEQTLNLFQIGDEDTLRHHESLEDHEDFIEKRSGNNLLINDALGVQVPISPITFS